MRLGSVHGIRRRLALVAAGLVLLPGCWLWLGAADQDCDPNGPLALSHLEFGTGGGTTPWVPWTSPQPVSFVFGGQGSPMITVALGVGVPAGSSEPACLPQQTMLLGPSGETLAEVSTPLGLVGTANGLRITDLIQLPVGDVPPVGTQLLLITVAGDQRIMTTLVVEAGP